MGDYTRQLAEVTGLPHYPKQGPFSRKEGAVIGNRQGFLVAVGNDYSYDRQVRILIRFKPTEAYQTVKRAVDADPAVQAARGKAELGDAGTDFLLWQWSHSLGGPPKAEAVAALLAATLDALKQGAQPFDALCEVCQKTAVPEILLYNSIPGYYCEGCQQQMHQELDRAAVEYEALPTDFARGLAYGLGGMFIGGVAWGLVAYWLKRVFLYGAVLIGYLVARAVQKGMGKIERKGQVLVGVLTIASVLFGDALFFTLIAMDEMQVPFSLDLLFTVLVNLWKLEAESGGGIASLVFALIGAGLAVYTMRRPAFKAKFERLGAPSS